MNRTMTKSKGKIPVEKTLVAEC